MVRAEFVPGRVDRNVVAGLPGANLEVWKGRFACHHKACDRPRLLRKGSLGRAIGVAEEIVRGT